MIKKVIILLLLFTSLVYGEAKRFNAEYSIEYSGVTLKEAYDIEMDLKKEHKDADVKIKEVSEEESTVFSDDLMHFNSDFGVYSSTNVFIYIQDEEYEGGVRKKWIIRRSTKDLNGLQLYY